MARKLGLSRARVTQLLDLFLLAPDLQQAVLALEAVDGAEPLSERALRAVAHAGSWVEQRGGVAGATASLNDRTARGLRATHPSPYSGNGWNPLPSATRSPHG